MAHIFSFCVLEAVPDLRRGERVNVGIVIFLPDRLDIRLPETGKLRVLREGDWDDYLASVQMQLIRLFKVGESAEEFLRRASLVEGVIRLSQPGRLSIDEPGQYEDRIHSIMMTLVSRLKGEKKPYVRGINSEIAGMLRTANVLATPSDNVDDGKKVFQNYPISYEEELSADFLLKNGHYHVTVTLDLRRSLGKGQAALKAIVLDKAKTVLSGDVQKIAVYAAPVGAQQFRPHIGILTDYADPGHIFNWLDQDQRARYRRVTLEAINDPRLFQLGKPPN